MARYFVEELFTTFLINDPMRKVVAADYTNVKVIVFHL